MGPPEYNTVYLTFDDGPTPRITEEVLNILAKNNFKATFFCVGKNIVSYPEIYQKIKDNGHSVGNHTYSHLNGWKVPFRTYLRDVVKCREVSETKLFRPPYGKIGPLQLRALKKREIQTVFWSTMSYDFDHAVPEEKILRKIKKYTRPGTVIVFHDSIKAGERLLRILPEYLEFLTSEGFIGRGL